MKDTIKIILFINLVVFLLLLILFLIDEGKVKNFEEFILIICSFYFICILFFKLFFKIPKKISLTFKIIFLFCFTMLSINFYKDIKFKNHLQKLRKTMADMRLMANIVETYYEKNGTFPFPYYKGSAKILLKLFKDINYKDGWGNDILYWCFDNGKAYLFQSAGKDKKFERIYFGIEKKKYEIPKKGYFSFAVVYLINKGMFFEDKMGEDTIFFNGTFAKWCEGFCNIPPNEDYKWYIEEYLNSIDSFE